MAALRSKLAATGKRISPEQRCGSVRSSQLKLFFEALRNLTSLMFSNSRKLPLS
jgi:hypothetical protein